MTFLIRCIYWINHKFRQISDLVVGNTFEPKFDIVCITGGSTGLGKEIVKQIANKGAKVVVLDVKIPDEQDKIPNVTYYLCDVSKRTDILETQKLIRQEIGVITVLINNAGITTGRTVLDLSFQEIEKTIQINLLSSFYTIKAFLPDMLNLKRGYIITIASVLGYMSPARLSAYGASKSGLIALHESLTYELGPPSVNPHGVKTLLICPGQLKTNMFQGVATPSSIFAPELNPEFVANCVVTAIEQGRRGEIKLPLYGKFIPLFRAMPWPIVEITRKISGIDKSMNTFKNKLSRVASSVSSIRSRFPSAVASGNIDAKQVDNSTKQIHSPSPPRTL
ncbi:putative oxidoreductase [Spathaspora sp. JA1]|nr:putative oxidoreductase [Spathaspora sp. JA1]